MWECRAGFCVQDQRGDGYRSPECCDSLTPIKENIRTTVDVASDLCSVVLNIRWCAQGSWHDGTASVNHFAPDFLHIKRDISKRMTSSEF